MFRRILSLVALAWIYGFLWFAVALPQESGEAKTDGVIVLTGGEGRIDRGLNVLRKGWSKRMLVSGVDRDVKPREFAAEYKVSRKLMACCVTLGYQSIDTRSNARESAEWIAENKISSVRLVTTDWHMRRAAYELQRAAPKGLKVIEDAVQSRPSFKILFLEYHKFLARQLTSLWDG